VIAVVAALQQFKQGLPVCEAIDTKSFNYGEFSDSLDIAVHPADHFELIEGDLKMHGTSILEQIGAGVKAYRAGDFETFGKEMGGIIKLATKVDAKKKNLWQAYMGIGPVIIAPEQNMTLY